MTAAYTLLTQHRTLPRPRLWLLGLLLFLPASYALGQWVASQHETELDPSDARRMLQIQLVPEDELGPYEPDPQYWDVWMT